MLSLMFPTLPVGMWAVSVFHGVLPVLTVLPVSVGKGETTAGMSCFYGDSVAAQKDRFIQFGLTTVHTP